MFPSSAHINDTLVSIVTKGERRGKGVLHWAKGIQPKAATQGEWKEGSAFPTAGLSIHCGLCLPSGLSPRTLHIQMQWCAEQKSYQGPRGAHGDGGVMGEAQGRGWHGEERKGDFTSILFLQMGAFKLCIFQALLIYPGSPWGVQQDSLGRRKP